MYSILLIEPNVELADQLLQLITKKQYCIRVVHQLSSALKLIDGQQFDVIISATSLPDGTSRDVLDYAKQFSFRSRVMILAQNSTYADRVESYKLGVDDYMVKPFNQNEFWWRLNKLCHSRKVLPRKCLRLCEGVSVYPTEGVLKLKEKAKKLPKREAEILGCLLEHKTRVVRREELIRWVWSDASFTPKNITLDVYIKRIRLKLGEYSPYLETVRGFGYRIKQ